MKEPQTLTLEYLKNKNLIPKSMKPTYISSTSLNFTYQHKVPRDSTSKLLLTLSNNQTYYGLIVQGKA